MMKNKMNNKKCFAIKSKPTVVSWMSSTIILFMFSTISAVHAAPPTLVPVEGMKYTINASLKDNLSGLMGKRVTLTMNSGKVFTGIVKSVGAHLVHLEKIERKEFFDALIQIDSIEAIDARFRKYQR